MKQRKGWRMSSAMTINMSSTLSPTFPSLHLSHSSFSNPSFALPTSQLILQPFRCLTYVTAHSPALLSLLLRHMLFTYVTWRAAHAYGQGKTPEKTSKTRTGIEPGPDAREVTMLSLEHRSGPSTDVTIILASIIKSDKFPWRTRRVSMNGTRSSITGQMPILFHINWYQYLRWEGAVQTDLAHTRSVALWSCAVSITSTRPLHTSAVYGSIIGGMLVRHSGSMLRESLWSNFRFSLLSLLIHMGVRWNILI